MTFVNLQRFFGVPAISLCKAMYGTRMNHNK